VSLSFRLYILIFMFIVLT